MKTPTRYCTKGTRRTFRVQRANCTVEPGAGAGTRATLTVRSAAFLTKWRGDRPISSSSARMIGEAPEHLHGLALALDPVDGVEQRAGADEIDALDRRHVDRRRPAGRARSPAACRSAGWHCPAITPDSTIDFGIADARLGRRRLGRRRLPPAPARAAAAPTTAATSRTRSRTRSRDRRTSPGRAPTAAARAKAAMRPSPPSRPLLTAASSAALSFCGRSSVSASFARRASASAAASSRAPASSNDASDDRSSFACAAFLRDRPAQPLDLRRAVAGELAGDREIAAGAPSARSARRSRPSQPGAERSNCTEYWSASWSNAFRSPARCSRSNSASQASGDCLVSWSLCDALLEQRARARRLAARVQQRGVLEHRAQPGIGLRDLDRLRLRRPFDQARAGDRLVGVHRLELRPVARPRRLALAPRARAPDTACAPRAWTTAGFGGGLEQGIGVAGFLAGGL